MAGYRETFGANVDYAYQRGSRDIASSLQRGISQLTNSSSGLSRIMGEARNAKRGLTDLGDQMEQLRQQIFAATDPKQIQRLTHEFQRVQKSAERLKKELRQMPFDALQRGLGKVTKGLISMNTSILTIGFDFLISSIKRVYELQERWTKAIGGFNLRIGGMTAGLRGAQKAATAWSSTIRGLTDGDINEGIQMFADFTDAIGRTVQKGDQFERFGIQLARGFNLGGQGSGQLTKVFENLGNTGDTAAETMKQMVKSANAAHVPVNLLAKDILDSSVYMARFGKEGQKTFVQGAAWARKFTITMEQLKNSVEGLDMFDEAARTASKLNTTFGTMINSMDLMLEDDPAKRLEMIRQQFLAQGTTFEKLTPKQRRYLSETLKLTEDQTAALLSAQKAGESYADFQAKAEKRQKDELSAKQMMEKQLRKTAQTMYAFGMAFDRVTVAIANAIKPLLQVLGLAGDGDKKFTSFGQVMESITKTVERFFNSLAKNDRWNSFMKELAKDLQRAGKALKEFVFSGGAADLVGEIARGMKSFYITVRDLAVKAVPMMKPLLNAFLFLSQHIKELAIAWAGLKVFNMAGGIGTLLGGGSGAATKGGRIKGALGQGAMMSGLGAAAGGLVGGSGGAIGGAIGGMLGPIGAAAGAAIGWSIKRLYDYFTKNEELDEARAAAAKAQADMVLASKKQAANLETISLQQKRRAMRQSEADDVLERMRKGKAELDTRDIELVRERIEGLKGFGGKTDMVSKALEQLNKKGSISADTLKALSAAQADQKTKFDALSKVTNDLIAAEERKLDFGLEEIRVSGIKNQQAKTDIELESLKRKREELGKQFRVEDLGSKKQTKLLEEMKKLDEDISKAQVRKADLSLALSKKQADINEKHYMLDLRRAAFEDPVFKAFAQQYKDQKGEVDLAHAMRMFISNRPNDFQNAIGGSDVSQETVSKLIATMPRMAMGGVVARPTAAIIGEAGPEAVIPLRRGRENLALQQAAGGSPVQVVTQIAEVTLDGQRVGRALVRSAVTGRN